MVVSVVSGMLCACCFELLVSNTECRRMARPSVTVNKSREKMTTRRLSRASWPQDLAWPFFVHVGLSERMTTRCQYSSLPVLF